MPVLGAVIPAIIGGGAAIAAANSSKKATQAATKAQADTATTNNTLQRDIYNENKTVLAPFVAQGSSYNTPINALLGSNPFATSTGNTFQQSPGYQFALDEAFRGVNAGAGASGLLNSGSRLKSLQDRAVGLASQEYNNWWNQDQAQLANMNQATGQYLNALTGQQGMGLSAAGAQAGVGLNYANNVSNNNWNAANASSNASLLNGANQNSLLSGIAGIAGNMFGNNNFNPRQSGYLPSYTQGGVTHVPVPTTGGGSNPLFGMY